MFVKTIHKSTRVKQHTRSSCAHIDLSCPIWGSARASGVVTGGSAWGLAVGASGESAPRAAWRAPRASCDALRARRRAATHGAGCMARGPSSLHVRRCRCMWHLTVRCGAAMRMTSVVHGRHDTPDVTHAYHSCAPCVRSERHASAWQARSARWRYRRHE